MRDNEDCWRRTSGKNYISELNENCHGKVRYISGWVVAKLIHCHKSYIKKNVCSSNMKVRAEMNRRFKLISLLEGLLVNSSTIHGSTIYTSSLEVIDQKQYRKNTLVYVNDETFEFFMELEKCRVNSLSHDSLKKLKGDMFSVAVTRAKQNARIIAQWKKLFVNGEEKDIELLLNSVVERYYNMGCGQYLRDFRRDYNIQKTEAHRKRVIERKNKKDLKEEKITLESIRNDESANKVNSHRFLVALVSSRPTVFDTNLYNKAEIKVLFQAYGLRFAMSWNKAKLNEILTNKIKTVAGFEDTTVFTIVQQ